jgi:hypothetical protein
VSISEAEKTAFALTCMVLATRAFRAYQAQV